MSQSQHESFDLPIICPSCGVETPKSLAWHIANTEFICACGYRVNLASKKWRANIQRLAKLNAQAVPTTTPLDYKLKD